jgi:hypothetical protein
MRSERSYCSRKPSLQCQRGRRLTSQVCPMIWRLYSYYSIEERTAVLDDHSKAQGWQKEAIGGREHERWCYNCAQVSSSLSDTSFVSSTDSFRKGTLVTTVPEVVDPWPDSLLRHSASYPNPGVHSPPRSLPHLAHHTPDPPINASTLMTRRTTGYLGKVHHLQVWELGERLSKSEREKQ